MIHRVGWANIMVIKIIANITSVIGIVNQVAMFERQGITELSV